MLRVKEDRDVGGWRTEGMSDETYQQVLPHINDEMTNATAAALQWYLRNRLSFERQMDNRDDVLLVAYEELVRAPRIAFERISEFVGISLSQFMISQIHSASVKKRATPDLSAGARALCAELWERFDGMR